MKSKEVSITISLSQDIVDQLPQDAAERRELINRALKNELDGLTASALGKKGGSSKSMKKQIASRENGKKYGGRPRKVKPDASQSV